MKRQNAYMAQFIGSERGKRLRVKVSCTVFADTTDRARETLLSCYDNVRCLTLTLLKEDVCTS